MSVSDFISGMLNVTKRGTPTTSAQPRPMVRSDSFGDKSPILYMDANVLAVLDRTEAVAQPVLSAFDRSKATAEYDLLPMIGYEILGVVQAISPKLALLIGGKEVGNLTHYNTHKAFCKGIEKVSKAFAQYRSAEKAAQEASSGKLTELRDAESDKAAALIDSYNELIALAAGRADYKADIHEALTKTDEGLILSTVDEALAKLAVGNGVGDPDQLKADSKKFLLDFTGQAAQAVVKTGAPSQENVKAATDAFIAGLASFTELASGDVDIIDMHADFVRLRNPSEADKEAVEVEKDQMVSDVVLHFTVAIISLMNGEEPISLADLQKISYQGIPLVAIRNFTEKDVEKLEAFRRLRVEREKALAEKPKLTAERDGVKAVLDEETVYSASDIGGFLFGSGKKDKTLETARAAGELTSGFQAYKDVEVKATQLQSQIEKIDEQAKSSEEFYNAKIKASQKHIDTLKATIESLNQQARQYEESAIKGEKALAAYEAQVKRFNSNEELRDAMAFMAVLAEKDLGKAAVAQHKKLNDLAESDRGAQAELETRMKDFQEQLLTKEAKLKILEQRAAESQAEYESRSARLNAEYDELVRTPIDLSGDEIRKMAEYLGLDPAVKTPSSSVTKALTTAREQHQSKVKLDNQIAALDARVKVIEDVELGKDKRPEELLVNGAYRFIVDDKKAFSDVQRGSIREKIDENLDIAKEVTARIAISLADKTRAIRESNREALAKMKGGALRGQVADMPSRLESRLEELDVDANEDALYQRIGARVNLFPIPPAQDDEPFRMDPGSNPVGSVEKRVEIVLDEEEDI